MSVIVAGEALVDLVPQDGGSLLPLLGGSPYNVAVGAGRLATPTHYLGVLSNDRFGEQLAQRLTSDGVDLDLATRSETPTTLAVVHLDDDARASYAFYLDGTSAGTFGDAAPAELPVDAALHVSLGAVTLVTDPAGVATRALLERERGRRLLSLDPNVRPTVIDDLASYARVVDEVVRGLDLVKVSDEDLAALHPDRDPLDVAADWAVSGPGLVVVTRGPDGATALRPDGEHIEVPGRRVDVVDTVGAGDAFTSGLLSWLDDHGALAGREALAALDAAAIRNALERAIQVAAITCTRPGADPPRRSELTSE